MIFKNHLEYIDGTKFSSNHRFNVDFSSGYLSREEAVIHAVKGKNIIHLGFAGHFKNIEKTIKKGKWFHGRLYDNAALCVGVDINAKAVNFISEHYNYKNIFCSDILDQNHIAVIEENNFDYMVLGEVLEHVDNPVDFITKLRIKYKDKIKGLIITVPNAFRKKNFYNALRNIEKINSDHRYWFSPYTITKVLHQAGCSVEKMYMCAGRDKSQLNIKKRIERFFSLENKFPMLRDTIVVFTHFNTNCSKSPQ